MGLFLFGELVLRHVQKELVWGGTKNRVPVSNVTLKAEILE